LDEVPDDDLWTLRPGSPKRFRVGDTEYVTTMGAKRGRPELCIKKPPGLVDRTVELLRDFRHGNIVELGISLGGSTALIAQVAEPAKFVALELSQEPVKSLETFLDATGRRTAVRPHYGVDQADRDAVPRIIQEEFGSEPLDLVTDDASHLLDLTRTSFEMLFPRLRPGGTYIIEDWNWEHVRANAVADALATEGSPGQASFNARLKERLADRGSPEYAAFETWFEKHAAEPENTSVPRLSVRPLSILALELLIARAWSGDVVSELTIQDFWVIVRRGPAELDPDTFRVADIVDDRFGLLPRS
jgi:predicted O-methyltransferase YrrM